MGVPNGPNRGPVGLPEYITEKPHHNISDMNSGIRMEVAGDEASKYKQ
jgi:hypothetical protein